jgi:hypothetical protein
VFDSHQQNQEQAHSTAASNPSPGQTKHESSDRLFMQICGLVSHLDTLKGFQRNKQTPDTHP